MFSDLSAVETYLNSLINYEARLPLGGRDWPKLEPTLAAVSRLGLPLSLSQCLHIAGTKGKGSTATFLEALLGPDFPTLSFTSPHLISFTERVRLNGGRLDERWWCEGFSDIVDSLGRPPAIKLSYFECTFIFYLWAARRLGTKAHIVETGLGGKWDATNVLENTTAVLTLVDYDHTEILGKTLTEIASDKAGIIKPRSRVVVARQPAEAWTVYEEAIADSDAESFVFERDFWWTGGENEIFSYHETDLVLHELALATPGKHQRDNAAVAIRAARLIEPELKANHIRERLRDCVVPGRQQLFSGNPVVMVDVAHNPASFAALANTLAGEYGGGRILAVTGLMKDKDARACFEHLKGLDIEFLVVPLNSPRSYPPDQLASLLRELGLAAETEMDRDAAFARMHDNRTIMGLVTGSFYLAGDYLKWRERARIA